MIYDLVIVGGSAAATSAGIYAARRGLNFIIITKEFGGEVATSGEISNWPGVLNTDGVALSAKFKEHLKSYGVIPEEGVEVESIKKQDDGTFCISAKTGKHSTDAGSKVQEDSNGAPKCDYTAKAVIVTTGVHPRPLGIPGEKEYRNQGVSYCTTCDGPIFKGKIVATIGGGNSALESALMLSDISKQVYVINKNAEFKGEKVLVDKLMARDNVEIISEAMTSEVLGEQFVTGLKYKKGETESEIKLDGIFVHIGMVPNSFVVGDEVKKDDFKYIKVDKNAQTNIEGLYAAGDVTDVPFHQIVIAAGQGTVALLSAVNYLNKL